jgi:hypothetical protein
MAERLNERNIIMPESIKAWTAEDGSIYATAEEAARRDLFNIVTAAQADLNVEIASKIVDGLMIHAELAVSALTTGPRTRPKARKAAGTTNPKRAAKRATPEQAQAGFAAMRTAIAEPEPIGAD